MIKKSENKLFGKRKKKTSKKKASIAPKAEVIPEPVDAVQPNTATFATCRGCRRIVDTETMFLCANCGMGWCEKCGPTTRCPSCGKICFA